MESNRTDNKKKRKLNKKKLIRFMSLILACIVLASASGVLLYKYSEKVKNEKIKAELEEVKKREAIAKKKEEERKKKELEEALNSIKPPEANTDNNASLGVPRQVLPEVTKDSLDRAYEGVLVIGDSRTDGLKLFSGIKTAKFFSTKSLTVNRIFEGKKVVIDGAELAIYDVLGQSHYSKIVICVGLNEVGWNNPGRFLESYGALVDKIKEMQPNAQIFLHSILPVSKSKNDSGTVFNNVNISTYNEGIVRLSAEKNVKFVNSAEPLLDNVGFLLEESSADGIHLSGAYCRIWAQSLADIISPGVLVNEADLKAQAQVQPENQGENADWTQGEAEN